MTPTQARAIENLRTKKGYEVIEFSADDKNGSSYVFVCRTYRPIGAVYSRYNECMTIGPRGGIYNKQKWFS